MKTRIKAILKTTMFGSKKRPLHSRIKMHLKCLMKGTLKMKIDLFLLGMSSKPRLLIVVHCERDDEEIRIISARKATKKESKDYEKRI